MQKALLLLDGLLDDIRGEMTAAADSLDARKPADAVKPQTGAVETLDNVFMAVAPFVNLVQKAVAAEEGLIEQSKQGTMSTSTKDAKGTKRAKKNQENEREKNGKNKEKKEENRESDWPEAAWNQRFISGYGRVLAAKARHELDEMAKAPAAPAVSSAKPGTPQNAQQSAEQQKELKRALQAGVDLAPKVETLSDRATAALNVAKPADALPPQEEALRLLKEMLPKDKKNDRDKKRPGKEGPREERSREEKPGKEGPTEKGPGKERSKQG